ncbi:hypothetical protein [Hyphobacterium sp.]|uniref:hypothetical protein n=1 Tax=Hyphobacterium sp. TaxID=2004662 RepID=UPI003749C965
MARTNWQARTTGFLLGISLAVPSFGMLLPDDGLSFRLNRNLTEMPMLSEFTDTPIRAFQQFSEWYSERVLLGVHAVQLMQQVRYYWLGDAGAVNTLRTGSFVFLSTHAPEPLSYAAFAGSCRPLNADSRPDIPGVLEQINRWSAYWQSQGITFANLVIPSKPVLYADELPGYVPFEIRRNCAAAFQGEGYLSALAAMSEATHYPLEIMREKRDDPLYYPALNFHSDSESILDALLSIAPTLGLPELSPELTTVERPADLRGIYQIERMVTVREPASFEFSHTEQRDFRSALIEEIGPISAARRWTPNSPSNNAPILIFGNSFSIYAGHFARIFNTEVIQVSTNRVSDERLVFMLSEIVWRYGIGTVIFVHEDAAIANGRLRQYDQVLEILISGEALSVTRIEPIDMRDRFQEGWFNFGPNGLWSRAGETARLVLPRPADDGVMIWITGLLPYYLEPELGAYTISVCGNSFLLSEAEWPTEYRFILSVPITECSEEIALSFGSPDAPAPADLGISTDERKLGIFLDLIEFRHP